MASLFRKATREQAKLRAAFIGPAGAGKTYTALAVGTNLVPGGRVAVIDTECGSAELYAGTFDFDTLSLTKHSPLDYVEAIEAAEAEGYDVVIVDSLSHAWIGKDGALEQVDKAADRDPRGNSFTAWRNVTPKHTKLVDKMISCKTHLIVTIRAKTEFVQEKNEKTGKTEIRKIGLAPIQRDGLEYEFGLVGDIDLSNQLKISKTRLDGVIAPGDIFEKPGKALAQKIYGWLMSGAKPAERKAEREPTYNEKLEQNTKAATDVDLPESARALFSVEKTAAPALLDTITDDAFRLYLEGMRHAPDVASLDRLAVGPGKPTKGSENHTLAIAEYKRIKSELSKAGAA